MKRMEVNLQIVLSDMIVVHKSLKLGEPDGPGGDSPPIYKVES